MQRCLYPLFQSQCPIFCCPLFSENYLNPQVKINKMVNKHAVNYQPSPSRLTSKIHPLIFLWTPKEFISPESFFIFFLKLYNPPLLRKSFKFIVLLSVSQKIESVHFYPCPQAKFSPWFLSLPTRQKEIIIPPEQRCLKIYFSPAESRRGLWYWKYYQK